MLPLLELTRNPQYLLPGEAQDSGHGIDFNSQEGEACGGALQLLPCQGNTQTLADAQDDGQVVLAFAAIRGPEGDKVVVDLSHAGLLKAPLQGIGQSCEYLRG